jgi:predicted alpha/beta hydrolase
MGNVRGNRYSQRHATMNSTDPKFWKFSWDEMAKYDLDAMIDKVLNLTGASSLYYIGHSQGTEIMFTKLSTDTDFHTKV